MADYEGYYPGTASEETAPEAPTWGDYAKSVGASLTGAGADLAGGARYYSDDSTKPEGQAVNQISGALQGYLNYATQGLEGSRTEAATKLAGAAITSKEFWQHPVAAGLLQLSGMTGPVAAMVFSGGPLGAAIANGALTAGSFVNSVQKLVDGMDSGELEQNNYYTALRSMGMDEAEARQGLIHKLVDGKDTINALTGAAVGAIGPLGKAAAGVAGKAAVGLAGEESGVAARAALGAAEGGVGVGAQAGVANATLQNAGIDLKPKQEFDEKSLVDAVLTGGALGAATGAAAGAAFGGKPKSKTKATPEKTTDVEATADQTVQEQGRGKPDASVQAASPTPAQEANVSVAPAPEPGAKGKAIKNKGKAKADSPVTVVEPATPTPEQALAIAETAPKTPAKPAEAPPEAAPAPKPVEPPPAPETPPEAPQAAPQPTPEAPPAAPEAPPAPAPEPAPVTPKVTDNLDAEAGRDMAGYDSVRPEPAPVSSVAPPAPEAAKPKRAPKILKNLQQVDETAPLDVGKNLDEGVKVNDNGDRIVKGRNMGPKAKERVSAHSAVSDKIVGDHPATEAEANYFNDKTAQAAVVKRAEAMVAAADAAEHKIPLQIKTSVNKDQITDHPATQMLVYARDLARAAKSKAKGTKIPEAVRRFKEREEGVKSGNAEQEVSTRKAEGEAAMRRDQGDAGERGATTDTPESILAEKETAGEEASTADAKDEAKARAAEGSIDVEKNAVETSVAKSAKGSVRGVDDATEERVVKNKDGTETKVEGTKAAGAVKKVAVNDEMKKKYEAMLAAASKKSAPQLYEQSDALKETPPRLRKVATGEEATPLVSTTVSHAIDSLDFNHMTGVSKALAPFMRKMLKDLVGHTELHVLSDEDMGRMAPERRGTTDLNTKGFFYRVIGKDNTGDERGRYIAMRASELKDPASAAHVIVHEAVHDVVNRAIERDRSINNVIRHMADTVREFARGNIEHEMASAYALTDTREFMAEAFSNKDFQDLLAQIPASDELVRVLKLNEKRSSVWDAMIATVRGVIERAIGHVPQGHSLLEAAIRVGDHTAEHRAKTNTPERSLSELQRMVTEAHKKAGLYSETSHLSKEQLRDHAADALTNTGGKLRLIKDKLSSAWMMKERNNDTFGPSRPLNRIFDLAAMQAREKDRILDSHGGAEVVQRTAELERTHPDDMAKGADLLFDASLHNVNLGPGAKNDHLGKDATKGWQAKRMLAALQKRYNQLSPEVQAHLQKSVKFFRDIHNEVSMATIKNVLEVANIHEHGLAERIFNDGLTEADRDIHGGEIVKALEKATSLKKLDGWYAPFRRYGDFISTGEHELAVPKDATLVAPDTVQFLASKTKIGARRAAKNYVEQASHTPQGNQLKALEINKVTVDKNDPTKLVPPEDLDAVTAYRVHMQTQHTEFHDTLAEAQRNETSLSQDGLVRTTTHKREDAHRASPGLEGALGTVMRSLENNASFKKLDGTQKQAVKQGLLDASVRAMSSTNVKSTMAVRRNVGGMSRDLGRVAADYARMTANYLAQLRYRPKIDKVFAEMRDYMKAHKYDKDNLRRDEVYQEFQKRIYGDASKMAERAPSTPIRKLLQVSRLARLAGVSFHVINSQEPWTTSLPMIGARHGVGKTFRALAEAYNTIGARGGLVSGIKDTARAFYGDSGFADYAKQFKDNIAKSNTMGGSKSQRLMDMIDYMDARNLYGNSTMFEVGKSADPSGNIASRALDRADLMANQVGSAIEAINRTVTGLTAYELEYKKNGGNHEAAMHYAYTIAHETMGDYSSWNAAPMFNTRGGQLALQFKKFGHKTYYMLGKTMQGAIAGDREAAKQFIGLMVTHAMVAGVLGLPTEPLKVALMAANAFGITGFTPDDYDDAVRQLAARVAGKKGGELITRGLYRGAGIELSSRMGLDNLMTYGSPKSEKSNDIKAFLFDTMAGAPAGYLMDQIASAQALAKGDVATAIEKTSPIRAVSDVAKAVDGALHAKKSAAGRVQRPALTAYETGVRALGFTPASVAEDGAMRGHVADAGKKITSARTQLIADWVSSTGSKKVAAQRAVQKFNAGQPEDVQISQKDLASAAKRRSTEEEKGTVKRGIAISKRTKQVYDRAAATYNP